MASQRDRVETTKEEREGIAQLAVDVFNIAFDDHRIFDTGQPRCLPRDWAEEQDYDWNDGRDITVDDIKVTQVWSRKQRKAAHMGHPTDKPHYRLGIRFKTWRRKSDTIRLSLIVHEVGHLVQDYHPHCEAFWHRIADATQRLCDRYEKASDTFGFDFSTHALKNDVLTSIKWADADEMDKDRDEILFSTARRLNYPPEAVGNMRKVSVGASEFAQNKADTTVPIDEVTLNDYENFNDQFVWGKMVKHAPAGFTPDERFSVTTALPVVETEDGYQSQGTTAEWQAVAVQRIWEHRQTLRPDAEPPEIPVVFEER